MAFNIDLCINNSEKNRIGKTLSNHLVLTGNLRESCDLINPMITIEGSDLSIYNYCHIPIFNRYYFINKIMVIRNNLWSLELHVDVLESFKTSILNLDVIVDKSDKTSNYNKLLDDGSYINQANSFIQTANFTNAFSDEGEFILMTAGAGIGIGG